MEDLKSDLRRFIEEKLLFGKKLTSNQEALFTSGAVDSFGVLELIAFLERRFGIDIDTQRHELIEFDTVDSILRVVTVLRAGGKKA